MALQKIIFQNCYLQFSYNQFINGAVSKEAQQEVNYKLVSYLSLYNPNH